MFGDNARTFGVSFAIHAAVGGALFALAGNRILSSPEPEYIEFEVLPPLQVETEVLPPPPPPVPKPQPIPTQKRPAVVPDKVRVTKVDTATPFQRDAITEDGARDAPENTEAVPAATAPLSFDMDSTVGGGSGLAYSSDAVGGEGVEVGAPGKAGGKPGGAVTNQGARDVKVARDWQITREPDPINDRKFEPNYPPVAKRQGREATVVVQLDIDATGKVVKVVVLSGPREHGFRKAARAYAKKLRFKPARAGTKAVAARIEWTVQFNVRN